MPKLEHTLNQDTTYLRKTTAFYALGVIGSHLGGSVLARATSIVAGGLDSKVPNARLVGIKVLTGLYPRVEKDEASLIKK